MLKIPPADYWHKTISRGKYPLLLIYELNQGLLGTHKVTGQKTKMTSYCRAAGSSYLSETEAQAMINELRDVLRKQPQKTHLWLKRYFVKSKALLAWVSKVKSELKVKQLSKPELKRIYQQY